MIIRVVFDANALVAGLPAASGTLAELVDHWRAGHFHLVVSSHLLAEVTRAWSKPYWRARLTPDQRERILFLLEESAERAPITVAVHGVATHPEDDLVLATAVSAHATYLVSGDKQLLDLEQFAGVTIISPRQFLAVLDQRDPD